MIAIINGKIILPHEVLENKVLVLEAGKIKDIAETAPAGATIIDAAGRFVSPGLVDVHIHGSAGCDVMDATEQSLVAISKTIAQFGTTAFLPTTMTMGKADVYKALETIAKLQGQPLGGAQIIGAHMEGPFINIKYKGAQNPAFIHEPEFSWVEDFKDVIKLITYAPEQDENFQFTKKVKDETNVTLSIGHSDADFSMAMAAIDHGVSHATHLFNAMTPLHHRDPGIVGAALMSDIHTELICDTIHVNPTLFQFVFDNKGKEKVVLITDCMRAGCMKDGTYDLGGSEVIVKDAQARLRDGTLAGSVLKLNEAIKNVLSHADVDIPTAIRAASLNPATSIGVHKQKGSLEVGKDADVVLFDEDFNCHLTIVNGEVVFQL